MDVIVALATPPGIGGIAVIRLSGEKSIEIADKIFHGRKKLMLCESHTIHYGKIQFKGLLIDTVLVSIFKSPNSYTGEDVIEISCHGGMIVANEILDLLIKNGARPAEAGEFTKRAFLNGKLGLTQVEAVADIIHSQSIPGVHTAARQLNGEFKKKLVDLRKQLVNIAGLLELELDFADEDLEFIEKNQIKEKIISTLNYCNNLAQTYKSSEILRSGYFVGITGFPNSGKSTLFNALLQKNRAIVSHIPGTTRDYLEESLFLGGINIRITDTAGIREASNIIEIEGIKMVESVLEQSNLILVLNDISISPVYSNSILKHLQSKYKQTKILLVQNKIDIIENFKPSETSLGISAKQGIGIEKLKSIIEKEALKSTERVHDILINQRQAQLLLQAANDLENALISFNNNMENEIISIDIRQASKRLGEITGDSWSEEVLNNIFENFCIGK